MRILWTILGILLITTLQYNAVGQQHQDSTKNIQIVEDPNLKLFYPAKPSTTTSSTTNKGFRVQIYDGNSKVKASEIKANFIKKYPGIRSYIKFHNPQYRVRIGDFTSREEAEAFQEKIKKDFSPSMVIPDAINVGTGKPSIK